MSTKISTKNEYLYCCIICDFNTSKLTDYNRHIETKKHIRNTTATNGNKKLDTHTCQNCGKEYIDRTGLWRHKQKCNIESNIIISTNEPTDKEIILKILKQNSELIKENSELRSEHTDIKELILEIVKNGTHNNNTTHTNSHNKAFNLNFFLNETCKNAMNITDFVDSIKLQLSDLMSVGELGYVEGISNIIVKNLNNLDQTIRPIHCTDKKRETMYVKDEDKWEKDEEKKKLNTVVNKVTNKNIRLLPQFREKYPEYRNSSSHISDTYDKTVIEVMSGDNDNNNKIIKNISKNTTILEK